MILIRSWDYLPRPPRPCKAGAAAYPWPKTIGWAPRAKPWPPIAPRPIGLAKPYECPKPECPNNPNPAPPRRREECPRPEIKDKKALGGYWSFACNKKCYAILVSLSSCLCISFIFKELAWVFSLFYFVRDRVRLWFYFLNRRY